MKTQVSKPVKGKTTTALPKHRQDNGAPQRAAGV